MVDRRYGAERRSTRDRRGRLTWAPAMEAPSEHIRNALQLLHQLAAMRELPDDPKSGPESANILAAAIWYFMPAGFVRWAICLGLVIGFYYVLGHALFAHKNLTKRVYRYAE